MIEVSAWVVYHDNPKPLRTIVRLERRRVDGEVGTYDSAGARLREVAGWPDKNFVKMVQDGVDGWFYVVPWDLFCGDPSCDGWIARGRSESESVALVAACDACGVFPTDLGAATAYAEHVGGRVETTRDERGRWCYGVRL